MDTLPITPRLVDRKGLCRLLGNVSLSHIIRLEKAGVLSDAKMRIGKRMVRYDMQKVYKIISDGLLACPLKMDKAA